jgi:hypothetical protein
MQLFRMPRNLLRCKLIEGMYAREEVLIPRITPCCDQRLPFMLYKQKFPVIGANAMEIHKSQRQAFNQVDVYL